MVAGLVAVILFLDKRLVIREPPNRGNTARAWAYAQARVVYLRGDGVGISANPHVILASSPISQWSSLTPDHHTRHSYLEATP